MNLFFFETTQLDEIVNLIINCERNTSRVNFVRSRNRLHRPIVVLSEIGQIELFV
jgi:hypothetical protein